MCVCVCEGIGECLCVGGSVCVHVYETIYSKTICLLSLHAQAHRPALSSYLWAKDPRNIYLVELNQNYINFVEGVRKEIMGKGVFWCSV